MNLLEAARSVNRSEDNSRDACSDSLCNVLGLHPIDLNEQAFQQDIKEYWLLNWYHDEGLLGISVGFVCGEAAYIRYTSSHGDSDYEFVSSSLIIRLKDVVNRNDKTKEYSFISNEAEIDFFYEVYTFDQIIAKNGFYKGMAVTLTQERRNSFDEKVSIKVDKSGEVIEIPIAELNFKIHISE